MTEQNNVTSVKSKIMLCERLQSKAVYTKENATYLGVEKKSLIGWPASCISQIVISS